MKLTEKEKGTVGGQCLEENTVIVGHDSAKRMLSNLEGSGNITPKQDGTTSNTEKILTSLKEIRENRVALTRIFNTLEGKLMAICVLDESLADYPILEIVLNRINRQLTPLIAEISAVIPHIGMGSGHE